VTGASRINDGSPQHAFVWDPIMKNMTDLGAVFGGDSTLGWGINNSGQVSGSSANRDFVWDPVTLTVTNLGTLGGNYSTGFQINNSGQVKTSKVRMGILLPEKMYLRLKRQSAVRKESMAAIVARALENELSALEKAKS